MGKRLYRHGIINTIATLLFLIFMNGGLLVLFFLLYFMLLSEEEGIYFVYVLFNLFGLIVCGLDSIVFFDDITLVDEYEDCLICYRWLRPVCIPFDEIKDIEIAKKSYQLLYSKHNFSVDGYAISLKDASKERIIILKSFETDGLVNRWRAKYPPADVLSSFQGSSFEVSSDPTSVISAGDRELKADIGQIYVGVTGVRAGDELNTYTADDTYIIKVNTDFNVYEDKATTDYSDELTVK